MINNILKKIEKANEVQKVELEKHEIELALVDDLKQSIAFIQKANDSVNLSVKNYEDSYKKMQTENKGAKSILDTQAKLINVVEAKAKELGINAASIPNYNEVNKSWETLSNLIDKVNEF
jgi:predicted aspartyl protease